MNLEVARARARWAGSWLLTGLAFLLAWFALLAPNRIDRLTPGQFVRIPIEGLVLVAIALLLRPRTRVIFAALVGVVLGGLCVIRLLDMGFYYGLDRPFNPVSDWSYLGPADGVLRDSIGSGSTRAVETGVVVVVVGFLVLVPLALIRLTRLTTRYRLASARMVTALGLVWILCAVLGVQAVTHAPIAASSAAGLAYSQVDDVRAALKDQRTFEATINGTDPYAITPAADLLTGLRGKDVVIAVVESYGRVAVQDSAFSDQVDDTLRRATNSLNAAGFGSRSAFLTSPTFGGISWLAHSTLQTGLWVDNQQRYDQVVKSDRFTVSDAFKRAGWRTVGDVPSNTKTWPEGTSFYHYDQLYDEHNVGYAGPRFSYASMPDQYSLAAFQRLELSKPDHPPVMAEIDLVSSHTPWTPLPSIVPWDQLGDGSVYNTMPPVGGPPSYVWRDSDQVKQMYGQSIQYSVNSLVSFVQNAHDDNLVLIMYGDHQPATIVSGSDAGHDVPISIIAKDPKVLDQISSWAWQPGLLPSPQAPVWPMDSFRNRFLSAFGSTTR